ncbi:hypothetical protein ACFE04_025255 [Oxalis oulophora]
MLDKEACSWSFMMLFLLITLIKVEVVCGETLELDKQVLLSFKAHLLKYNPVNKGEYSEWNNQSTNPCKWYGVSCNLNGTRVNRVNVSNMRISGLMYNNFSALTQLTHLDLSSNTIGGEFPDDIKFCQNLVYLNVSHNILQGQMKLTDLKILEVVDFTKNRFYGDLQSSFPATCESLRVFNISENNFTGSIDDIFDRCQKLQYLDLSSNKFTGSLWNGFASLKEFSVSDNQLNGKILSAMFPENCSLTVLDLSGNGFYSELPVQISNCRNLVNLNLLGNNFMGQIPAKIGSLSNLEVLYLGSNNFSRDVPDSLLNLTKLVFLDLSKNNFGGEIQDIFGKFTQVNFLLLHSNSYTGGIYSSGILKLQNISRLDLSYNNFTGPLPLDVSQMSSLKFLILAYNQFSGNIPTEYGNLPLLQALDLSYNKLNGSIPTSFGNLKSLLWLMLANNSLSGEIPHEMGNCSSLLWLNLANNQLSGGIPSELANIGRNAMSTFESNREGNQLTAGSGECVAMKRWIPANYPPFSFVYTILTRKSCRSIWSRLLNGYGLFPACTQDKAVETLQITGYLQLTGNQLSGEVPVDIGKMLNFSMLHLGFNNFSGKLPTQIGLLQLIVLNVTQNKFSGEIPTEIGNLKCLLNLDLSSNNFSGSFPTSLINLTALNKFNISYNPLISGSVPSTGQLATFEKDSYLGDPLLLLPDFINNTTNDKNNKEKHERKAEKDAKSTTYIVILAIVLTVLACGALSFIIFVLCKGREDSSRFLSEGTIYSHDSELSSTAFSSPWLSDKVKVIRLDKTSFTHADILKATINFSGNRIIGKGGSGIVYRGTLPDGREVAVKKLQREGIEGEKEFRSEMEVLSGSGFGWPHPNLVTLYGWCLNGSEKLLVYEYMNGGSLEDLISDTTKLSWKKRINIAVDVARALLFLHHECYPPIVHRDVKASNVLLDDDGKARVTDFGLARVVHVGDSHVSTMIAGTVGYVAPEYAQTWQATTKGDVYSYGVLVMELATGRRAVDGGEECLVEWARQVMGNGARGFGRGVVPVAVMLSGVMEGANEMGKLLQIGLKCSAEEAQGRPNMKEVLVMLVNICEDFGNIAGSL